MKKQRTVWLFILMVIAPLTFANVVTHEISQFSKEKRVVKLPKNSWEYANEEADKKPSTASQGNFQKKYALVVFYSSTCLHCQRFLPVLKRFAATAGFDVYPYTVDGQSLPNYSHSLDATKAVEQVFFESPKFAVPSVFLVNKKNLKTYLVSVGEMSDAAFSARVRKMAIGLGEKS